VASTEYATVHGSRPAKQARSACHLRVRLPFANAAHPVQCRCMNLSLLPLSASSITAPPPHSATPPCGRQRHEQSTPSTLPQFPFSPYGEPRRPDRPDPSPPSARRIAQGVDPASPVSSLPSSAPLALRLVRSCVPAAWVLYRCLELTDLGSCLGASVLSCRLRREIVRSGCRSAVGCLAIHFSLLFVWFPTKSD
jgi:hypothetical protein